MVGIYKITNTINDKVYIGQSKNISQRWRVHRYRAFSKSAEDYEKPLYRAIRKYGLLAFNFEVIEECSIEDLNAKEKFWIELLDSTNPSKGYNLTKGGESGYPIKLSQDQVNQIIDLLALTELTQQEIADKFNISQRTVSSINMGETWLKQDVVYPIRKKEDFTCQICGKPVGKMSKYCTSCNGLVHRKTMRPSREELKNLIRTNSFVQIGKMFNVSDNAIRKWCKTENLPSKSSDIKKYSDEEWERI